MILTHRELFSNSINVVLTSSARPFPPFGYPLNPRCFDIVADEVDDEDGAV